MARNSCSGKRNATMVGGVYLQALHDVRRHFAAIKPQRSVLCELIVMRLIAANPEFRNYSAGREHAAATELERVLRTVVNNSRDVTEWQQLLAELGGRLGAMGVVPGAVSSFIRVFTKTIVDAAQATQSEVRAWEMFLQAAWGAMTPGMVRARPQRVVAAA